MHDFEAGAAFEGDKPARELFCRIVINWMNGPAEILPVELSDLVDVIDPDGYVFDLHGCLTLLLQFLAG